MGRVRHKKFIAAVLLFPFALAVGLSALLLMSSSTGDPPAQVATVPCPSAYLGKWLPATVDVAFDHAGLAMVIGALEQAQESIDVEMFLIGGEYGRRVLRLLDSKAREGVRVRLINQEADSISAGRYLKKLLLTLDPVHGTQPQHHYTPVVDELFAGELSDSPVQRAAYPLRAFKQGSAFLRLAHDKLIIIDSRLAITGGMNLATSVLKNHDLMIAVSGPAVAGPVAIFNYDWTLATGESPPISELSLGRAHGGSSLPQMLKFLVTRPECDDQYREIAGLIDGAQHRIWLHMFYLTEPAIIERLIAAHEREVDVRIIIDPNEYSLGLHLYGAPNIGFVGDLLSAGVAIRYYQSMPGRQMHQKSMIVDEELLYTGATNFTRQSLYANTESGLVIKDGGIVRIFSQRFREDWLQYSVEPSIEVLQRRRLYAWFVRFFARFI